MEGLCRGCLLQYNEPTDLLQYTEKNRRLFVYSTGLQVKRNDTFTFQLCKECYFNMKQSCKFKKQCRTSDKHFKNYLMLKEDGDDFGSFIKNMDENLSLRLPMTSGNSSTPAYQKNKDDDNESTCTSIRNFITDILEGEEMPPSEARLIREVIQEETDVLDDSLDSHWLQDDRSIGSDFDVDFGISPFATPRTIQNDHCYTPRRIVEAKQREINYLTSKEIIEKIDKPGIVLKYDMPLLDDMNSNMDFENVVSIQEENYIIKTEETTDNKRELSATDLFEFDNSIPSEVEDMVTENSISSTPQCFKTDLLNIAVKKEMGISVNDNSNFLNVSDITFDKDLMATTNENDICIVVNQGIAEKSIDEAPLINELEYYVNKAEIKKQITSTKDKSKYHCTIDRNLDIALKHEGNKQFSLDQLITSPADSIHSGVSTPALRKLLFGDQNTETVPSSATSTPTIKNILFGEKLDSVPKYFPQVGQSMDNLEDDKSDINILQDFFENDVNVDDEIKESNIKIEPKDFELNIENYQCNPSIEINQDEVMKSDEHIEVLEEFLRGADDDQLKLNGEIIDPLDLSNELSDKDLFKRPLTPPYNKYDLEKCLCKLCDRTFMSEKSLKIHFAKTHKYKFPNSDPHRNKSQSIKIKVCNICGKAIKGAPNYLRHMKLHQDKLIGFFQCDNCKLFFKSRMALQVHMRMHMGIVKKQKKFVCPTCGKVSATSSHHKLHIRRHLKEISDTCDFCHKGFYSAYDLKAHMRIHSGERPYVCEYCTKAFRRRNELQLHMKRHMGKLEFKCDACNIEFVSKEILAKHYASKKCIKKREEMSQKSIKDTVAVKYGKGSLEKIRTMMQSTNSEKDIESDKEEMEIQPAEIENSMIQSGEIENGMMQSTKLEKDIESDNEEMENGMIQSTEIENNMIQSAEIENGIMQSTMSEKDIESDNEEIEIQSEEIENEMIQSAEIENGMMQSTKSKKDIESDNEEMENGLIQSAEIENGMMQSVEIENGMIQSV